MPMELVPEKHSTVHHMIFSCHGTGKTAHQTIIGYDEDGKREFIGGLPSIRRCPGGVHMNHDVLDLDKTGFNG